MDWLRCETKNHRANNPVLDEHRHGGLYDGWQPANGTGAENFTGDSDSRKHRGSRPDVSSKAWSHLSSNDWNMRKDAWDSHGWGDTHNEQHRGHRYKRHSYHEHYGYKENDHHDFSKRCFDHDKVAPVPVPAAVWLFGSGLLGLIGISGRKKSV
jgi:hypothetical protein